MPKQHLLLAQKPREGKEDDAVKGEIQMIVGSIARLGRAAGVHMAVATQRPER